MNEFETDFMFCKLCGELFDKRDLSEVLEHEHTMNHSLLADKVAGLKGIKNE